MQSFDNMVYESDNDHSPISESQNNDKINDSNCIDSEVINNFEINSSTNQINCIDNLEIKNEINETTNTITIDFVPDLNDDKIEKKSIENESSIEFKVDIENTIESQNNLAIKSNNNEIELKNPDKPQINGTNAFEKMEIEEPKIKKPNPFKNKSARQNFIKKVYLVLFGQLISSFIIFLLLNKNKGFQLFAQEYFWLAFIFLFIAFIITIPMSLYQSIRTKSPYNYLILSIFTLLFSISISFVRDLADPDLIELTISIMAAIILSLTLLAVQNLISFNILNSVLLCISINFLSSGIGFIIYHIHNLPLMNVFYAASVSFIASMYIVIDTHLIIKGHRKEKYTEKILPEEWLYGSLAIYIDTIRYTIIKLPKHISKLEKVLKYLR